MRKFRKWMIKNYGIKAWEKYKKAIKSPSLNNRNELTTLKEIEEKLPRDKWVEVPFIWYNNGTCNYWHTINIKWRKYVL